MWRRSHRATTALALLLALACGQREELRAREVSRAARSDASPVDASAEPDSSAPDGSADGDEASPYDAGPYDPGPEMDLTAVACERNSMVALHQTPILPAKMKAPLTAELAALTNARAVLRVYSDGASAMLGPVGWRCQGWGNAAGGGLTVAPRLTDALASEVVSFVEWLWGTSGRRSALNVGAPVFPGLGAAVLATDEWFRDLPKDWFRLVPWPGEKLQVDGKRAVFEDPPWTNGTGTETTGLTASALPIRGAVIDTRSEVPTGGAMHVVAVRLSPPHAALFAAIRADIEARVQRCRRFPDSNCWGTTDDMLPDGG